ncbi:MAG: sodium:alanine symporter family protein [Clostridiales bacterium]|nr:sodium:alanine symporter family protein [Clostridiales bacterium]
MQVLYDVLNWIDGNILWGIPMLALIIASGVFLTIRLKGFQVRKFGYSLKQTMGRSIRQMKGEKLTLDNDKAISPFEAFSTAVSGTVGTGNIVGVTTAILSGGPGAVFWMWISAFFGMITKYAEITLSLFFRKKDEKNEYIGGPMFYIEKGLKCKWLAIVFAVFAMLAAIGMSSVQADTIQSNWNTTFNIPTWVTAIIIAVLTALVVIGGIKRIGKVASMIVPFMAILFLLLAIVVICVNGAAIPAAFASIFASAFTTKSILGGFAGYGIMSAMRYGFARGVFSNEAGLGSSPIAHATSSEVEPVRQGLWGIFEVFLDTFVICTLTALFVLTANIGGDSGANVALASFSSVGGWFGVICKYSFSIILPLFAFTTILAWAVYGAKACQYIFGKKSEMVFNVIYVVMIIGIGLLTFFGGNNLGADFVWLISDMTNALMALPNLIALIGLSGLLIKITKNYFDRKKGNDVVPMLSAYDDVNEELAQKIKGMKID